jgi:hypothetical protein
MKLMNTELPSYTKNEMEKLQEVLLPFVKKASRNVMWSFPLIAISIFNIFTLLFATGLNKSTALPLLVYAVIGAFGMALSKEAKLQRAEIQKVSVDYVIDRIKRSESVSEPVKERYMSLVRENPLQTMNHFVHFLEAENRAQ